MASQSIPLQSLCEINDGTHYTPLNTGGPFPFLTVKDISEDGISFKSCSLISAEEFEKARKVRACPQQGDVLFSKDGTVGKVFVVDRLNRPFAVLSSIAILRPKTKLVDSKYLGFALRHPRTLRDAEKRKTGSALQRIILDNLKDVEVPIPDLPEQKRIAAILERADRLRRLRRYEIELAESLPASIARTLCDPKESGNKWPLHELGELCEEVIDCPHSTPVFSPERTLYPCVRSSDIQNGYLDFSQAKYVNIDQYKKRIVRGAPRSGDVIYCREGARFGNAGRVLDSIKLCLGQRMMLFRPKEKMATSEFVWAFLSSTEGYLQATRALDGSASPHVNIGEIVAFRVAVPPLSLQERLTAIVRQYDRLREVHRESLRQAEHLFQTLLHRAFTSGL